MSDRSTIEWTNASWNPVTGCTKVSTGCKHCYAETIARRFWGNRAFSDVRVHPDRLDQPLHWRRPRLVFVNSMGDLFHPDVPDEFITAVWNTMRACESRDSGHVFQILTKRPDRMVDLVRRLRFDNRGDGRVFLASDQNASESGWPLGAGHLGSSGLQNVWLGVTAENQAAADERIPVLLQVPAAVRFVSCEPLLAPIDFRTVPGFNRSGTAGQELIRNFWVIVGGETGPGARPMDPQWARALRDQCKHAGVPFFFKRWGGRKYGPRDRELDGRMWEEMPRQTTTGG